MGTCFHFSKPDRNELGLILLAAVGCFFAFPNPIAQFPPLVLLTPAAIYLLALRASSSRRALWLSFFCCFLGASASLYWLAIPMQVFAAVPLVLAAGFVMLLGLLFGMHGFLFALLARLFTRGLPFWPGLLALAVSWGMLEHLRGFILTGFPWLSLSSAFAGWPLLAQGASLFGMYGLSAVYALFSMLLASSLLSIGGRRALPGRRWLIVPAFVIGAFLALYGWHRMGIDWEKIGETKIMGLAQGNTDQSVKWTPENRERIVATYLRLSRQSIYLSLAEHERMPDLLIWPETAMPFVFKWSREEAEPVRDFARKTGIPLLFGVQGVDADARLSGRPGYTYDKAYNRVLLLDERGQEAGRYDKEHLVPFGEYVPPGLYVPFATEFLQGTGFTPGNTPGPIRMGGMSLGMLICYEVIFPELARERVRLGANLLVSVSNDAWFGRSSAPRQHLQLAAMRSIEQARYMVRATNSGISALIDPNGRIHRASPLFEEWAQVEKVQLLDEKTFYQVAHGWIAGALWLVPSLLAVLAFIRLRKVKYTKG